NSPNQTLIGELRKIPRRLTISVGLCEDPQKLEASVIIFSDFASLEKFSADTAVYVFFLYSPLFCHGLLLLQGSGNDTICFWADCVLGQFRDNAGRNQAFYKPFYVLTRELF